MAYNNPYSAYTQTGVKTATQGKLVVMLYNEAVKQLNSAINWFNSEGKVDPCHIEKFSGKWCGSYICRYQTHEAPGK